MKIKTSTILYILSFLIVFPASYPLFIIIGFVTESASNNVVNLAYIGYLIFISIVGSAVLNFIFRFASFDKNNKFTWSIFIAHLLLIPLSVDIYEFFLFK